MAETDCGSCKEFECCLQGGAHFFFKVSPSYVFSHLSVESLRRFRNPASRNSNMAFQELEAAAALHADVLRAKAPAGRHLCRYAIKWTRLRAINGVQARSHLFDRVSCH